MKQPLKSCFHCCSLEAGAYILSTIGFFGCLSTIILSSYMLEHMEEVSISENDVTIRLIAASVSIILYILLIIGTKTRNSYLLLPFLILNFIVLGVQVVSFLLLIPYAANLPVEYKTTILIGYPIGLAMGFYVLLCMVSLYIKIRNEKKSGSTYNHFENEIL